MKVIDPCCDCHEEGSEIIDNYIRLAFARTGVQYNGKPWIYCPWCGAQNRTADGSQLLAENYIPQQTEFPQ